MKRILFFGLTIFLIINSYSQNNVNDYKYILVPKSYDFLKENDAYQLNSLTKFLFNKYGFTAFLLGEELPNDLNGGSCKLLKANVKKKSSFLKTKLVVDLIDCNGLVVFSSKEGSRREKEYKKAYNEALRDAFEDIKALNYTYNNKKEISEVNTDRTKVIANKKETTSIALNEAKVPTIISNTNMYTYNGGVYIFEKQEFGFELKQKKKDTSVSIGKIFKSSRDNTYVVKAGDLSGNGYFDAYRNFNLERINPATNKLITDIFARQ